MSRCRRGVLLFVVLTLAAPTFFAADDDGEGGWAYDGHLLYRSPEDDFALDVYNILQSRAVSRNPELGRAGQSFDVNRYRILADGQALGDWLFRIQADLATGSLSDEETESNLLLDAFVRFAPKKYAQVWVGQGKVAFGRQQLMDSWNLQFVDRSIASERFAHGRDVGIAFVGESTEETYAYSVGIYNGNGINEGTDENRDYMAAARLVVRPMGSMPMTESDPDWTARPEPRLSVGVAVMTNQMGEGSFEEERINRGALEFQLRARGFSLSSEFFTESEDTLTGPVADETDTDGWYAQAGYLFPVGELHRLEFAGRYSEILRDVLDADETEAGVAVGFYFRGQRNKIQADYRVLEFEGLQFGERVDNEEFRLQVQLSF